MSRSPTGSVEGLTDNAKDPHSNKFRRRDRKTISCTTCRKRKIRCDRIKPVCGACKKNNVPAHLCVYDDSPWVSTVVKEQTLRNQIDELKQENEDLNLMIRRLKNNNESLQLNYEEIIGQLNQPTVKAEPHDSYDLKHKKRKLDIKRCAICKFNKDQNASRTFGALSWQAIGLREGSFCKEIIDYYEQFYTSFREQYKDTIKKKEALSVEIMNWRQIYQTLNIQKRYSSIITDSENPNRDDAFGKKLQELAKSMPSYKIVERKLLYFFEMKYDTYIDHFFTEEEIVSD